jgi:RND family efflux transporter MFP subunit
MVYAGDGVPDNAVEKATAASSANDPWTRLKQAITAEQFAATWLEIQSTLLVGARRGVVVLGQQARGPFAPVAMWPEGSRGSRAMAEAVEHAIRERKSLIRDGKASTIDQSGVHQFVAAPVVVNNNLYGAAAFEIGGDNERDLGAIISTLEWGVTWIESYVRQHWTPPGDRLVTVLETVATSVHHQRFQEAVTAVATELAGRLGCERVTIGFVKGKHAEVRGVSHSATFGKKANLIRAIEAAMDEAIDQQATVLYPAPEDGALQVTRAHAELHDNHGNAEICTVPFADGEQLLGAMTLEMPKGEPLDEKVQRLCEHAASLLGPILDVKRKDDRWLVRKAIDSGKELIDKLLGPRNVGLKLGVGTAVFLLLFFALVNGDYRVTADARLEGTVQRVLAAPMAGYIAQAEVRAGDIVKEGQVMASLDDRDLKLEHLKWRSQRSQRQREQSEALARRDRAQAGILAAQIEQAEAQMALISEQLARVAVKAPFDGVVVTGDLSQSLGAPVERGEMLFEVAPLDSYRVILEVDERDVGEVVVGQSGTLALTGLPEEKLLIRVDKITPISEAGEGRNFFRVEASLDDDAPKLLRPGMEGVGKVDIGERKLIWIWTHKITYWLRMFFWSWWP